MSGESCFLVVYSVTNDVIAVMTTTYVSVNNSKCDCVDLTCQREEDSRWRYGEVCSGSNAVEYQQHSPEECNVPFQWMVDLKKIATTWQVTVLTCHVARTTIVRKVISAASTVGRCVTPVCSLYIRLALK